LLAEEESRELVIGGIGQFWKLWGGSFPTVVNIQEIISYNSPNHVKAAIFFYVHQNHGDDYARVSTETRFYVPDQITQKKFARYWLPIHTFSAFTRRMWLRAINHKI
jgi:hypothetical protein